MTRIIGQARVGVIGVGRQGQRHCRIYATLRHAQLMGVCDASIDLGRKIARQYGASFYRQFDDLLDNVEAVSLATPTPQHYEFAMRCIERGVHVLIEKPITQTLEQAEALVKAAEDSNLVVMIGHVERFNPAYIELKSVLEEMSPLAINIRRLSPTEGSNRDVDVVLDLMIHDTNLILDLMGKPPTTMEAYGIKVFSGAIDHAIVQMSYEQGPLVTMTASRITEQKIRSIEVTIHDAYIECDLFGKTILLHRRTVGEMSQNHKYRQESVVQRIQVPTIEPQYLEQEHFINCILNKSKPSVSARDGLNALRFAMDVRERIQARLNAQNTDSAQSPSPAKAMALA
jgi:virulence factor